MHFTWGRPYVLHSGSASFGQLGHVACRNRALASWDKAPKARESHPREEHLLPLHVCAGAAGEDAGRVVFEDNMIGVQIVSFEFGEWPAAAQAA